MMGVDYELFWTLNPKTLSPFIKAFSMKREMDDEIAWRHGAYIKMAIASAFDTKHQAKYPKAPLGHKKEKTLTPPSNTDEGIKQRMLERMKIINAQFRTGEKNA